MYPGMLMKRDGDSVTISCDVNTMSADSVWQMTCVGNKWIGSYGNCSNGELDVKWCVENWKINNRWVTPQSGFVAILLNLSLKDPYKWNKSNPGRPLFSSDYFSNTLFDSFYVPRWQHDDGYIDGWSQIKVHTDEWTQVHITRSSLAVTHPSTNRGRRRCLTSGNVPLS